MVADDFPARFADTLREAGKTLEENGYAVHGYRASILDRNMIQHSDFAETPDEALEGALDEAADGDRLEVYLEGDALRDAVYGDDDLEDVVYQTVRGQIEIDNPMTDQAAWQWEDEPLDREVPAVVTVVRYVPDSDDGYFEVGHEEFNPPYTVEDVRERSEDIVTTLEEAGFDAERYN